MPMGGGTNVTEVLCFATTKEINGQITANVQYSYRTYYYTNLQTN